MKQLCAAVAALLLALPAAGKSTSFFVESAREQFEAGNAVSVSITERGELALAPYLRQIDGVQSLFVWSMVSDGKGNVYAGTGNEGIVYRIDAKGDATPYYTTPGKEVMCLALDDAGNLYAGTVPKGIIYRIGPDGRGQPFCVLEDMYVWSLAPAPKGGLYAGCGYQGRIFRIDSTGKQQTFLETRDTHFLALTIGPDGLLYAGSAGEGIVYRITHDGKPTVLLDTEEDEVGCLLVDEDGVVYAGTAAKQQADKQRPGPPGARGGPPAPQQQQEQPQQQQPKRPTRNSLYRIAPDGDIRRIFTVEDQLILSLAFDGHDRILVGTGNQGIVYRVDAGGKLAEKVIQVKDLQVLSMAVRAPGDVLVGTGNMGNIQRMGVLFGPEGVFTSQVLDANYLATWGQISWDADVPARCRVAVQTRSGNSEFEDATLWSDWSLPYTNASGQKIESPASRFLQYRAYLASATSNATPLVRSVKIPYRLKNQAPVVGGIQITQNVPQEEAPANQKNTRPTTQLYDRKIQWSAKDPDGDTLRFAVDYRGDGEETWKVLDEDLDQTQLVFDSRLLPDGRYRVRVTGSDYPSNTDETTQTAEDESDPFVIDNTRPTVEGLRAKVATNPVRCSIEGRVRDNASIVTTLEYSVDSADWTPIDSADGVLDSLDETISFQPRWLGETTLPAGEHTVIVKAEDEAGNVGTGKVVFTTQ